MAIREIIDVSDNSSDEMPPLQVPNSSPKSGRLSSLNDDSSPVRPSNRLSLMDRFKYRGPNSANNATGSTLLHLNPVSSLNQTKNYKALKDKYPSMPSSAILSALKRTSSLAAADNLLSHLDTSHHGRHDLSEYRHDVVSSKVEVSKGRNRIIDNYSKHRLPDSPKHIQTYEVKRKRLMKGSDILAMATKRAAEAAAVSIGQSKSPQDILSDSEEEGIEELDDSDLDEDVEDSDTEEQDGLLFEERVLKFLNEADIRDVVDIAGVTPKVAQVVIDKRPFGSLAEVETKQFEPVSKNNRKKPLGEKIVEMTSRKLHGYETVESLVKQCKVYGNEIKRDIKRWGVDVDPKSGELQITKVVHQGERDEEGEDDDPDESVQVVGVRFDSAEPRDSDDSEDEDWGVRKSTPSRNNHIKRSMKRGYFSVKPKLLADDCQLKDYQQVGVNWLSLLYGKDLSCILADEMGLGKTIQVIAFLAHLKQIGQPAPHLIVVPASTLENWLREFKRFAPSLDVRPYYGSQDDRDILREELEDDDNYDVLVTTYSMATGNKYDQQFLKSRQFNVIVYDEGHMLKNSSSTRYQKLMKLHGQFRLLLTGTPLQNNLRELISLLSFVLPQVFQGHKQDLEDIFDQKATTHSSNDADANFNPLLSQQAITNARTMMTPFVLRRKKDQVMKDLPSKHNHIEYCDMTVAQRDIYDQTVEDTKNGIIERRRRSKLSPEELNKLPKLQVSFLGNLMMLRKACLHPLLFRYLYTDEVLKCMSRRLHSGITYRDASEVLIFEDMQVMSDYELNSLCHQFPDEIGDYSLPVETYMHCGKVQQLMKLVGDMRERKEKVLVFSMFTQVLDILEKAFSVQGIKFVRLDGSTSVDQRQEIIDTFYDDEAIPVFLLSTKAGGFGINLVAATNVIIYDMSFNPHDDRQAEDRAHRVGQTKDVDVYRLVCKDTIEENILKLAYDKLELDSMMNGSKDLESAIAEDINESLGADASPKTDGKTEASGTSEKPSTENKSHGILRTSLDEECGSITHRKHTEDPEYQVNFSIFDVGELETVETEQPKQESKPEVIDLTEVLGPEEPAESSNDRDTDYHP